MTGRDLIIYILSNGLEDEPVIKDGKFIGYMTTNEAAVKMNVCTETVRVWVELGMLDGMEIGEGFYIPINAESPLTRKERV